MGPRGRHPRERPSPRTPSWRHGLVAVVVLLAVCGAGIGLYLNERSARQKAVTVGMKAAPRDRLDIEADVRQTDPEQRTATLQLTATPHGRFGDGEGSPVKDITLVTNAPDGNDLRFKAYSTAWLKEISVPLTEGTASDYPFDRYTASLVIGAIAGQETVPVTLRFRDEDSYFAITADRTGYEGGVAAVTAHVTRSRSTFILAWFMIIAMWTVALAVVVACWLVVRQGRGLVWGALGWMAGSLFALVGLRNAASGNPPNGSLLDYAAFYWAEALIALSLTWLVLHGVLVEHRTGGPVPEAPQRRTLRPPRVRHRPRPWRVRGRRPQA
ncbi:hypothetical protein HMPREF1211_02914 [Streptomyces sp. HGB0020]|nr:hypothetical protein HMPREF1211_02914 [Streptomyces sp. HGB0020]